MSYSLECGSEIVPDASIGGRVGLWSADRVERALLSAMEGFLALNPDRRRRLATDGPWGRIIPTWADRLAAEEVGAAEADRAARRVMMARRRTFSAAEVSAIEAVLAWVELVPATLERRRVVGAVLVAKVTGGAMVDWASVQRMIGTNRSRDGMRVSYRRSLKRIANALNAAEKRAGVVSSPGIIP